MTSQSNKVADCVALSERNARDDFSMILLLAKLKINAKNGMHFVRLPPPLTENNMYNAENSECVTKLTPEKRIQITTIQL